MCALIHGEVTFFLFTFTYVPKAPTTGRIHLPDTLSLQHIWLISSQLEECSLPNACNPQSSDFIAFVQPKIVLPFSLLRAIALHYTHDGL